VSALGQLPGRVRALLDEPLPDAAAHETLRTPEARRLLEAVAEALERVGHDTQELDGSGFKALLQRCGRDLGVKGRALFMPVRVAMTGQQHGPELPLLFDVLGLERTRRRLRDGAA
jgi:nondiscriminating glutamyl-tRNA synthetase